MINLKQNYVYDGEWLDDLQSGIGREIKGDEKYTGGFLNGKYHGNGIFIDNEQNQYDGEWLYGKRSGMGSWSNKQGDQYKGEFFNDLFTGHGQFTFSNGDLYVGEFVEGKICGYGEYLYLNWEVYQGICKDGLPNGLGKLKKNSGIRLEGGFINGEIVREDCSVIYEDGRIFRGSVDEKYRPNGRGVMEYSSSKIVPGVWVHGIQDT